VKTSTAKHFDEDLMITPDKLAQQSTNQQMGVPGAKLEECPQGSSPLSAGGVKAPPRGWKESLRYLGPGIILVGGVVGSGELVATTLLGAQVGFVVLWLIILSCLIKVIIQEQFAYYVLSSRGTVIDALNRLPGPKIKGASWCLWLLSGFCVLSWFPGGGIVGMSGMIVFLTVGWGNTNLWTVVIAAVALLLFWRGTYSRIERAFVLMVVSFSFSQIVALVLTQRTEFAITWSQIWSGLQFDMPKEAAYITMAVFGITGISAAEVIFYCYWCVEKGYGRYIGTPDGTAEWRERARGWISVMRKDVVLTAAIYTGITVAFYLLGAAILHRTQSGAANLKGLDTAVALSDMFTRSFGAWSFYVFMIGAFMVLYSTYIAGAAAWPRFMLDFSEQLGIVSGQSPSQRNQWHNRLSIGLALLFVVIFFVLPSPVPLMLFGGILSSLLLPVLGFSAIYLFRKKNHLDLRPGVTLRALLWVATLLISCIVSASLYLQFADFALW
jgi:Mn2+/Fe2+ NRAMP family transporter